ncbi:RabGAP/TBC [Mytilinidion resinicola]|uniref:RabGAP/TBC n=1 Tax=Mytilinidion resinicola TaxID=574789 RepID=A0A6A6Y8I8_9PEZI|nr:RabGAP/TBC [Mytilinidion resinicola]KAF2805156.1 RabGAP/TBC [Mytilinidion resinicola]
MRTLDEARKCWPQLDEVTSISQLRKAVSSPDKPRITSGLRSICWKIFLLFNNLDRTSWPTALVDSRTAYDSLRSHFLRAIEHPNEIESAVDPLSEHEESPWVALRKDETLRAEIFQDVERCMPDNMYFRQPSTQNMMLDIIFIFCKLNPDVGYRQGMHEVLAPILWVVERDSINPGSIERGRNTGTASRLLRDVCDLRFMEHDTFTLFRLVMQNAKFFYAPGEGQSGFSQQPQNDTPMLIRSKRIFEEYLPMADPSLAAHLKKVDIVPQIFLMRWIRLLFGREFSFNEVLVMWDIIFAEDSSLELVDFICIAMLLRIRWDLVEADTNTAFTLLLRYPEPDNPPFTFVHDALYLRDNLNPQAGANIIKKYGKKSPPISENESRVTNHARTSIGASNSLVPQPGSLEAILQDAARGVYNRGEKWGIAKAVRDAVGEVKKNVQTLQQSNSGQSTPRSGGREYRKPARPVLKSTQSNSEVLRRISALETRNKGLAKMLEGALSELWECHKEKSDEADVDKASLEALSVAIAKVQFVQVYLEDASIPLPIEEDKGKAPMRVLIPPERTSSAPPTSSPASSRSAAISSPSSKPPRPQRSIGNAPSSKTALPIDIPSLPTTLKSSTSRITAVPTITAPSPSPPSPTISVSPRVRPALAQSAFSWMLGQDERTSTFASASAHTAFPSDEKRRMARGKDSIGGKGYLFGEDDEEGSPIKDGRAKGKGSKAEKEIEEEVIDLGPLGKSAVA